MKAQAQFLNRCQVCATIIFACLTLSGCGTMLGSKLSPISYHTLAPTVAPSGTVSARRERIIALQSVRLPDYLDRAGFVVRTEETGVQVAENDQWAGSLSDNVKNVIATNLSALLESSRIVIFPVNPAVPLDQVVQVDITRFDSDTNGEVVLDATWLLFGDGGRTFVKADRRRYSVKADDSDTSSIIRAMSEAVGKLSRDIAATLSALDTRR